MRMTQWVVFLSCLPLCHCGGFPGVQMPSLRSGPNPTERLEALSKSKIVVDADVKVLSSDVTGLKSDLATCRETEKKYDVLLAEKNTVEKRIKQLNLEIENLTKQIGALEESTKQTESEVERLTSANDELKASLASCMAKTEKPTVECPTNDGYTMDAGAELCYKIFTSFKEMANAKQFCMDSHTNGRLVVPNTPKKMEALRTACQAKPQELQLWLGAERREDRSLDHWSDGSSIDSDIWNDGEPNNWGGYEGCVTMDGRRGYRVNDENCKFVLNYICEVPMA